MLYSLHESMAYAGNSQPADSCTHFARSQTQSPSSSPRRRPSCPRRRTAGPRSSSSWDSDSSRCQDEPAQEDKPSRPYMLNMDSQPTLVMVFHSLMTKPNSPRQRKLIWGLLELLLSPGQNPKGNWTTLLVSSNSYLSGISGHLSPLVSLPIVLEGL